MLVWMCRRIGRVIVPALSLLAAQAQADVQFPLVELSAGMYRIEAELAHTPEARQRGLMHRREMADHRGMVFVFTERARHCMWMRNTFIPLSVAFLDDDGRIINIEHMTPLTEDSHCAAAPARYALEMNQGWFATRAIAPGARVRGVDRLPAPR